MLGLQVFATTFIFKLCSLQTSLSKDFYGGIWWNQCFFKKLTKLSFSNCVCYEVFSSSIFFLLCVMWHPRLVKLALQIPLFSLSVRTPRRRWHSVQLLLYPAFLVWNKGFMLPWGGQSQLWLSILELVSGCCAGCSVVWEGTGLPHEYLMCVWSRSMKKWESHGLVDPALLRACTLPVCYHTLASLLYVTNDLEKFSHCW